MGERERCGVPFVLCAAACEVANGPAEFFGHAAGVMKNLTVKKPVSQPRTTQRAPKTKRYHIKGDGNSLRINRPIIKITKHKSTHSYNTEQHNTTQHSTTQQHNITTQHNTTQHNTTQHNTPHHTTTQHTTPHHTTQHNTTQHNTTQHNTTQPNTTQHNTTQTQTHSTNHTNSRGSYLNVRRMTGRNVGQCPSRLTPHTRLRIPEQLHQRRHSTSFHNKLQYGHHMHKQTTATECLTTATTETNKATVRLFDCHHR